MNTEVINQQKVMQIATVREDQPWICTVYFVVYEGNFYWLSLPDRRHSKELENHAMAAVAVALKHDKPVTGIQAEGDVSRVDDIEEIGAALTVYVEKYGQGDQFVERFKRGENQHVLYRFVPRKVMLFDEYNHADNPYQKITIV